METRLVVRGDMERAFDEMVRTLTIRLAVMMVLSFGAASAAIALMVVNAG